MFRMQLTNKNLIVIFTVLLVSLYFGLYLGFLPLPSGLDKKVAQYNTVYIEGFSWDKMGQVQKGMTPQEVVNILGQPYGGMPEKPFCPSWSQSNPNPWKILPPFAEDVWWQTAQVCFDTKTNTVSYPGVENIFFN